MTSPTLFQQGDKARAITIRVPGYLQAVNYQAAKVFFPLLTTIRGFGSELDQESRLARDWSVATNYPETSRIEDNRLRLVSIASRLEGFLKDSGISTLYLKGQGSDGSGKYHRRIVWRDMVLPKAPPYGPEGENVLRLGHWVRRHAIWSEGSRDHARASIYIECPFCESDRVEGYIWSLSGGGKLCPECLSLIGYGFADAGELVLDPRLRNQIPNRLEKFASE